PAPEIQNFVKAYQTKFNVVPDSLAALAYDAAKVLVDAIKRAGGADDSAKLKDAINATRNFAGVTGTISLDTSRNAVKPAVVLELNPAASKFVFKETIYPEGMTPPTGAGTNSANNMNSMNSMSNANTMTNGNMMSNSNSMVNTSTNANTNSAANSMAANNTNR
ncbi:MAG TPA: ABC transporter substrate-binding protein, partial [Pyrinomonadaceae bacterium]